MYHNYNHNISSDFPIFQSESSLSINQFYANKHNTRKNRGTGFNSFLIAEKGLLAAILWRAICDLMIPSEKGKCEVWFLRDDISFTDGFSFRYVCEILDLNGDLIIKKLRSLKLITTNLISTSQKQF